MHGAHENMQRGCQSFKIYFYKDDQTMFSLQSFQVIMINKERQGYIKVFDSKALNGHICVQHHIIFLNLTFI